MSLLSTASRSWLFLAADGFTLNFELHDAALHLIQLHGHGVQLDAELGGGLVHQVDGLVGQKPVGDVARCSAPRRQ